jgi:site-specific recombinase XerD
MAAMRRAVRGRETASSKPSGRRQPPIRAGYEHFRLDREGALVSRKTLGFYDAHVLPFLTWLDGEGVSRFDHLDVTHARQYRARLASTPGQHGRPRQPDTLHGSHRAIKTFLRWAHAEGYPIDGRILDLTAPRIPDKEPTVYHITQVRKVLAACSPSLPTEDLTMRLLIGSSIRCSEACGLSIFAPDGLSDVMVDSLQRGRAELRVRWDGGAKGRKSRRIPITRSSRRRSSATRRASGRTRTRPTCSSASTAGRTSRPASTA